MGLDVIDGGILVEAQGIEAPDKMLDMLDQLQRLIGISMAILLIGSAILAYRYYRSRKAAEQNQSDKKPEA